MAPNLLGRYAAASHSKRDESDVQRLINTLITTTMSNPFDLSEASKEDPVQLQNIATGVVMPQKSVFRFHVQNVLLVVLTVKILFRFCQDSERLL